MAKRLGWTTHMSLEDDAESQEEGQNYIDAGDFMNISGWWLIMVNSG